MIQQSLVVGGRGNASVITLPFRPREPLSLPYLFACSAYIRTNSLNSTTNAGTWNQNHCRFWFYHSPLASHFPSLSSAFRRACLGQGCAMHHAGVTLVRGDPTLKNNAPESSSGRTARANFTCSPEKAVRASLSVSSVVSICICICICAG